MTPSGMSPPKSSARECLHETSPCESRRWKSPVATPKPPLSPDTEAAWNETATSWCENHAVTESLCDPAVFDVCNTQSATKGFSQWLWLLPATAAVLLLACSYCCLQNPSPNLLYFCDKDLSLGQFSDSDRTCQYFCILNVKF